MTAVLFVCTGNICRSPTAEAVFRQRVEAAGLGDQVITDSAGTHGYHVGEPPDDRAVAIGHSRGYDLSRLRARRVSASDYEKFHHILAMDTGHLAQLRRAAPPEAKAKVTLFLDFAPGRSGQSVPDPYYGGHQDFERMLDLVEAGVDGLLAHLNGD